MTTTAEAPVRDDSRDEAAGQWREVHPAASRWMHWINFPLLMVMIWSGLKIYWANDVYAAGIGPVQFFAFFPQWVYETFGLEQSLARGIAFHFTFGWLFAINGLAYGIWLAATGQWRHLVPNRDDLRDLPAVLLHDVGMRDEEPVKGRYNAAQRVSYTLIVAMGALIVLTGLAILKSTQLNLLTRAFGGYESARFLHFATTIGFVLFFVLHLVQVARAGVGNLMSMITGYERDRRGRLLTDQTAAASASLDREDAS